MRIGAAKAWVLRHLDEVLAITLLLWGVTATALRHTQRGPLALNLAVVVVMAAAMLVRRRAPLVFALVTIGSALITELWLDDVRQATWAIYLLVVPAYSVAAYLNLSRAIVGLAITVVLVGAINFAHSHVFLNLVFTTVLAVAAWTVGRALRNRRALAAELRQRGAQLAAERETRARLAVADERSRIARELHALVANSVSAMVVQAEAAQRLLYDNLSAAEVAMDEIEATGREALCEMRRILGVLRRSDEGAELAPQPGVGQLHALLERARATRRQVGLRVEGDPGPLPVAVDLAIYRIVEEALEDSAGAVDIMLSFGAGGVRLEISRAAFTGEPWPTVATSERVSLCEGALSVDAAPEAGERLVVELPQSFEEALA